MPITPSLLVSSPTLQDYLVDDATGLPLASGTITLYRDNSRTTFKNWYYLSGSPGSYMFITLPNPMTLSGVGTITDGNGNDVIPFFYPYSEVDNVTPELYYIVVTNSNGQQQFTRQNFPFGAYQNTSPIADNGLTLKNYIVNNVFWRNAGSVTDSNLVANPLSGFNEATLAPSSHDGLSMPDWRYISDVSGATDTLTFKQFAAGSFLNQSTVNPQNEDVTPEFYLNFACTGAGSSTYKNVQVPLSLHLKTLESVPAILVIWSRLNSSGGTGGNNITLTLSEYAGTGGTSPILAPLETISMTSSTNFTKTMIQFTFPTSSGLVLGKGGDDAWYLKIGFPTGQTFNIDIAKVQLYIGNQIPGNDADLYDQVDAIINSPRTGDLRIGYSSFYPFGWVPMNNGTIGNASSSATARANQDTWQLFSLLWSLAQPYDAGSGGHFNPICQMYTSAGATTDFGASAIADFNANNRLALTQTLGGVMMGTVPTAALLSTYNQSASGSNVGGKILLTVGTGSILFNGQTVAFSGGTLPDSLVTNKIYYVANANTGAGTFNVATTFANAMAGTTVAYVSTNGSGFNAIFDISGSQLGEYAHTQLMSELALHHHSAQNSEAFITITASASGTFLGTVGGPQYESFTTTTNTGNSTPFNLVQPSIFTNIFIKL